MHADPDSTETSRLLGGVRQGDRRAFDELFARHEPFLQRLVDARLPVGFRARINPSDVVQETQLEAYRRLEDFLSRQPMSFRLWLRKMACERIIMVQRQHVGAKRRTIDREVGCSMQSSTALARQLVQRGSSPSIQIIRRELVHNVRDALTELAEGDREILIMRTVESLSNQEVAQLLGIESVAASQRYGRALLRLRKALLKRGVTGLEGWT